MPRHLDSKGAKSVLTTVGLYRAPWSCGAAWGSEAPYCIWDWLMLYSLCLGCEGWPHATDAQIKFSLGREREKEAWIHHAQNHLPWLLLEKVRQHCENACNRLALLWLCLMDNFLTYRKACCSVCDTVPIHSPETSFLFLLLLIFNLFLRL
jgi:hypothetical protein